MSPALHVTTDSEADGARITRHRKGTTSNSGPRGVASYPARDLILLVSRLSLEVGSRILAINLDSVAAHPQPWPEVVRDPRLQRNHREGVALLPEDCGQRLDEGLGESNYVKLRVPLFHFRLLEGQVQAVK